ncbi:MAG TPA: hypothetical protein VIT23_08990, partial [Terrimicrobiaceae bacterium]
QEPAYAELISAMQRRVHDYVVADKGTAKEALDKLVEDWNKVFRNQNASPSHPDDLQTSTRT